MLMNNSTTGVEKLIIYKSFLFYLISFNCIGAIALMGCQPKATKNYQMHTINQPATLKTDKGFEIVKIDGDIVKIKHDNERGAVYSSATMDPGNHRITVNLMDCGDYTIAANLEGRGNYIVKGFILATSTFWLCDVWIEDAESGERVAEIQ